MFRLVIQHRCGATLTFSNVIDTKTKGGKLIIKTKDGKHSLDLSKVVSLQAVNEKE